MIQLDLEQLNRHEIAVIDMNNGGQLTMWVFRTTLGLTDFLKVFSEYIEVLQATHNEPPSQDDFCDFVGFHVGECCMEENKLLSMIN